MQLIDGKKISKEIKDELKEEVAVLKANGKEVCLAVVQVGNDPASSVYVNNKKKACAYIGIESESYELAEETTEEELLLLIDRLNKEEHVSKIKFQTTLAGYIHWKLTGKKVLGVGEASGMFPIDIATGKYESKIINKNK